MKRLNSTAALALAALFLMAGCKTVGPDFEKPDAPVADSWLNAEDERVDTSTTAYQDWWEVFNDPELSRLIDVYWRTTRLNFGIYRLRFLVSCFRINCEKAQVSVL